MACLALCGGKQQRNLFRTNQYINNYVYPVELRQAGVAGGWQAETLYEYRGGRRGAAWREDRLRRGYVGGAQAALL